MMTPRVRSCPTRSTTSNWFGLARCRPGRREWTRPGTAPAAVSIPVVTGPHPPVSNSIHPIPNAVLLLWGDFDACRHTTQRVDESGSRCADLDRHPTGFTLVVCHSLASSSGVGGSAARPRAVEVGVHRRANQIAHPTTTPSPRRDPFRTDGAPIPVQHYSKAPVRELFQFGQVPVSWSQTRRTTSDESHITPPVFHAFMSSRGPRHDVAGMTRVAALIRTTSVGTSVERPRLQHRGRDG
jgi:hypothetical protein